MPDTFDFRDESGVERRQAEIGRGMAANTTLIMPISFVDGTRRRIFRTYVWGWVTYNDVFKGTPKHLSEFCDEMTDLTVSNEDATSPSAQFNWKLAICKTHNCYDEECSDYAEKIKGRSELKSLIPVQVYLIGIYRTKVNLNGNSLLSA